MIIYKINFPNGKAYIGQTIHDLEHRKTGHRNSYQIKNNIVYRAIRKYGWDNIIWEVIDNTEDINELNEKEKYWIKYYNTYIGLKNANGYNMTEGGGGSLGRYHTEKTKQKISKNNKGNILSEETKMKMCVVRKGEGNANAKITEDIAREIKIRLASGDRNIDVKNQFGVTKKIVEHIKHLTAWKHILPVLNDLLKDNIQHDMSEDTARDIKIRLSQGDKLNDLALEYRVSKAAIRKIRNLGSWEYILPELNDKLDKSYIWNKYQSSY